MAIDCLHEPILLSLGKAFGASLGILGAALAWLFNNLLRWLVWVVGEWRKEYELIKALRAEIASNGASERYWSDPAVADKLIAGLKSDLGPYKPWTPYVAVTERNQVFDNLGIAISRLPAGAIAKVVAYYNLTSGLTRQLADFRSEAYAVLSHPRQVKVLQQVFLLGAEIGTAAREADHALKSRLNALEVMYGLGLACLAMTCFIGIPSLIGMGEQVVMRVTPAVEWASTCDAAPKTNPDTKPYKL